MEKLQLLESVLGKGSKTNRDYYQFTCPFHTGRHGPKLGISLGTGGWKCWVCPSKGHTIQGLFKKLNQDEKRLQLAKELWKEKQFYQKVQVESLKLPKEFVPLWETSSSFFHNKANEYLESRGVTKEDIVKHRLGFCQDGKYHDMVIFPSYNEDGQLTFFSGRTYLPNSQFKFAIPIDVDKNQVFDENLINWQEPVVIVESKLDAIVVKRNVTYLTGKTINEKLKNKIIEEQTPKLYFCLDGDALNDAILQSSYFIANGVECWKVKLPQNEDPNSLGYEKVWEYINTAELITESEIFKFKLLNRLK